MAELTRRDLMKGAGGAVAALAAYPLGGAASAPLSGTARVATVAWNHDPGSPIGPRHWADIGFPRCGAGTSQSPIDIDTRRVLIRRGAPAVLEYEVSELAIANTGHVVEVSIRAGVRDALRIGPDEYHLVQYHFHAPSEHTIDGRRGDVEAHFVHQTADGATAVIGVLYRVGSDPNPLLDHVLLEAPQTAGREVHAGESCPAELLHDLRGVTVRHGIVRVDSFYQYHGSLTTPGCTENVRWLVLAHVGQVSKAAVTRFHRLISQFPSYGGYPDNNRPVQPRNGRVVELRR